MVSIEGGAGFRVGYSTSVFPPRICVMVDLCSLSKTQCETCREMEAFRHNKGGLNLQEARTLALDLKCDLTNLCLSTTPPRVFDAVIRGFSCSTVEPVSQ